MQAVWITIRCNNACSFCPQREARTSWQGAFFEDQAILSRITEAARLDPVLAFVGGEPTLHPRLFAFATRAREAGASTVVMQTNGRRLAYAPYTRELAASGVTAVDVSLHGPTAIIHEFHTKTEGSFAQTLTGIGVARATGLRVGVTCVLTRSNFRHASDLARIAAARGAQALHLAVAREIPGGALLAPSLRPSAAMLTPYLSEATRVARALGLEVLWEGRTTAPWLRDLFPGVGKGSPS